MKRIAASFAGPRVAGGGGRRGLTRMIRTPTRWTLRLALAACLVLALGACSSTKFAYNRLDLLLSWYLGRYVDLDGEQSDWFDARIGALLDWHRAEELPKYVAFLDGLQQDLDRPLTITQVLDYTDTLELAWYRIRDPALEELLALGERLTPEQIDGFIAELRKRQEKYEKKYLPRSEAEFREEAADDLRDMLEDYLGRLSGEQAERVHETAERLARTDREWLDERAAWIDEMERLLQREPGWQAAIRSTISNWEAQLDETTLEVYERNTLLVQELVVAVVNERSERQDRRLRGRLEDLREDFSDLHGQAYSALPRGASDAAPEAAATDVR
jgi:hypothetical protein